MFYVTKVSFECLKAYFVYFRTRLLCYLMLSKDFLPARRYASAGLCDSDVSVCLSVRHTPVLYLAEQKQDREMYTI